MIRNPILIKILKFIAAGFMTVVLMTLLINAFYPQIEFPNAGYNRIWGFVVCYLCIISFLIIVLILKSFNKITKWILLLIGILITLIAMFYLIAMYARIEYEPRFDRYVAYRNVNKSNEYIVVQDYIKWKSNLASVDTTLITDYYLIKKCEHLDSINVKGTWVRFDENENIIDTIKIK